MSLESAFARTYPFPLDDFQLQANHSLVEGRSVLVCAPTGAGKTVVGEFGVWLALQRGGKAFYTTPLKALSNQKFGDFIARHGADRVGLLTGDNSINSEASVVVMTTEVLRNMLYEQSPTLRGLSVVVMDEVHYLKDPYRGATWEEVLIHLDQDVQVAALSATLSNAEEFGDWLRSVRGPTDVVIEQKRPVPIEHYYMIGPKLHQMFVRDRDRDVPNPALRRLNVREPRDRRAPRHRRSGPPDGHRRVYRPDRVEVVQRLDEEKLTPAIVFIFSRAGCEQAVRVCRESGIRLTTPDERERIREYVELRASVLEQEDLDVLGFDDWLDALERGIAAHHAGLIPLFKETVEELFERALCKVVFATETLSLGINMPAKTVVIERLMKFTGERHELMTPADFTQLTGRAGRRGMDDIGYGITLLQPDIPFERVAALAEGRSYPLISSFRPSYNMAVNLLRTYSVEEAARLLNLSFAQFLADRSVSRQERQIERNERFLASYRENAACDRGDVAEYWELVKRARTAQHDEQERFRRDRTESVREAFERLRPGDVVLVRRGPRQGLAAVVEIRHGKRGEPQPVVVTEDRTVARLAVRDFREPPAVVGDVRLPRGDPRAPRYRHDVGRQLGALTPREPRAEGPPPPRAKDADADAVMRAHPVYSCPDRAEHERWMQRIDELEKDTAGLRRRVRARTETLARTFERVLMVLETFGYVRDGAVTEKGTRLSRLYNESDLLVSEALETGVFADLDVPGIASVVSPVVFETRIGVPQTDLPTADVRRAFTALMRLYRRIHDAEEHHRLELVREPDPGFCDQLYQWASGEPLEDVLEDGDLSAGDFVRSTKQVWDLLRQLAGVAPDPLAERCRDAARAIYRGVVAYSGAL
ncbi:MAG: DEAD/DEAH box helicase [Actinobacteria bacterium]|nr:MAG: DEAD/DEAH box helicase [Actinomycetota bacterium]